jgi:hypothetical protein
MPSAARTNTPKSGSRTNRASFESGLRLRIGALLKERDTLQEEVRQLRAAVKIYTAVVRRLRAQGPKRAA